jgi:hypothetical protein
VPCASREAGVTREWQITGSAPRRGSVAARNRREQLVKVPVGRPEAFVACRACPLPLWPPGPGAPQQQFQQLAAAAIIVLLMMVFNSVATFVRSTFEREW